MIQQFQTPKISTLNSIFPLKQLMITLISQSLGTFSSLTILLNSSMKSSRPASQEHFCYNARNTSCLTILHFLQGCVNSIFFKPWCWTFFRIFHLQKITIPWKFFVQQLLIMFLPCFQLLCVSENETTLIVLDACITNHALVCIGYMLCNAEGILPTIFAS